MKRERRQSYAIDHARPDELGPAFRRIFYHLDKEEREPRVQHALEMLRLGELKAAGIFVARAAAGLAGALVCLPVPGASGLVWPPQGDDPEIEDRLVRHALSWLGQRGAKLAQGLLVPNEAYLASPMERNGFVHVTNLWYMRHPLELPKEPRDEEHLVYQSYSDDVAPRFQRTLLQTYEHSLDCPEVSGVRTIGEIIAGHRAQGPYDPEYWWLALEGDRPVGVLMMMEVPDWSAWDMSYVGVVPEARRRGFGREMTRKALREARAIAAPQLTLSVDDRNRAAWNLYRSLGFEPFDQRHVYLAILGNSERPEPERGR